MEPELIPHHQIDKTQWDECIRNSIHPLTTAQSWYLDIVAPGWSALVADDYRVVMPLPIVRKGPFRFLVQPLLVQQLGVFSIEPLSPELAGAFYRKAKAMCPFLNLNARNTLPLTLQLTQRTNYILYLNQNYSSLQAGFSKNCQRNLKKAEAFNLSLPVNIGPDTFIEFSQIYAAFDFPPQGWETLRQIVDTAIVRENGFCQAVTDDKGNPLAMAFFLKDAHRITFLSGTSSPQGLQKKAMFRMIDHVIQAYSNQNLLLDFEGSAIEPIARFYRGFGAISEYYYQWAHPLMRFILQFRKITKPKK